MQLYLNKKNFLLISKILFLLLFFTTACQIDQSLDKIRNTLFESDEIDQEVKKENSEKDKIQENRS